MSVEGLPDDIGEEDVMTVDADVVIDGAGGYSRGDRRRRGLPMLGSAPLPDLGRSPDGRL